MPCAPKRKVASKIYTSTTVQNAEIVHRETKGHFSPEKKR